MSDELKRERDKSYKRALKLVVQLSLFKNESLSERRELLREIGFAYLHAARPDKAAEYWREALRLLEATQELVEKKELALAYRDVAQALDYAGHFAEAEVHYNRGLEYCDGLEEDFLSDHDSPAGIIRMELADNLARQGKHQEALDLNMALLREQQEALNSTALLKHLPGLPVLGDLVGPLFDLNIARYAIESARMLVRLGQIDEALTLLSNEGAGRKLSGPSHELLLSAICSIKNGAEPKEEEGQRLVPFYQQ